MARFFTRLPGVIAGVVALAAPAAGQATVVTVHVDSLLRRVMDRDPRILAARARVDAARGARTTAGALPNPFLTYQIENAAFPGSTPATPLARETQRFVTLPLEPIWQRGPRVRRATEDTRAAEAELLNVRREAATQAARAFFDVLLAQITVRASDDIQEGLDSLVRYSRARVNEGAAAEGDLIRLEVERDRAATERVEHEAELVRARAILSEYIDDSTTRARPAQLVAAMHDTLAIPMMTLGPMSDYVGRAASSRPDVAAARARVRAASAETRLQRSMIVRQLGATFGAKTTEGVTSMIAGVSLPFPLFDQNRGEVRRAQAERSAAEYELVWAERRANADVTAAYEVARLWTQQVSSLRPSFLARAEEGRRIAVAAYQEGAVPLLQVLDATRTLADARITFYRALFTRHQSLIDLYGAAGLDPIEPLTLAPPSTGDRNQ